MPDVLVLISSPRAAAVGARLLHDVATVLPNAQAPRVLAENVAGEIAFDAGAPLDRVERKALADSVREDLRGLRIDVAVLPAEGRRKRLLLADMDSTMIRQECIDELGAEAGLKERIAEITARAMRGEIAFEPALRERVGLLAGLPVAVVDKVIATRIELMPGGSTLVATMRAHGAYAALVSGGFTLFTGPLSERLGFHEHRSNTLELSGGFLTGRVVDPILGREAKLEALRELSTRFGLAPSETLAVGDGANDLAMIEAAGLGVALHAKPAVAAAAEVRIDHGDLTALLYLQGYAMGDFKDGLANSR
jgi:phosphoserine phosphatase